MSSLKRAHGHRRASASRLSRMRSKAVASTGPGSDLVLPHSFASEADEGSRLQWNARSLFAWQRLVIRVAPLVSLRVAERDQEWLEQGVPSAQCSVQTPDAGRHVVDSLIARQPAGRG